VTPALEGWFRNPDGTATILVGYLNRNQDQILDIPVGPNNKVELPGDKNIDWGQPTHFERGRGHGVFAITVPKDFGNKRLTYTIVANNLPQTISLWLNVPYSVSPYFRSDTGNTPPVVKLEPGGVEFTGPPRVAYGKTLTATTTQPLELTVWGTDKGNTIEQNPPLPPQPAAPPVARGADPGGRGGGGGGAGAGGGRGGGRGNAPTTPVTVRWAKHRGPGAVKFAEQAPRMVADAEARKFFKDPGEFVAKATTTATFSQPGEYILRLQANDATGNGGGGDQCCWTNVHVKVSVK
jgi:hypothetical protein